MRNVLFAAAAVATLGLAVPAIAQTTSSTAGATPPAEAATGVGTGAATGGATGSTTDAGVSADVQADVAAPSAAQAGANASVTTGMMVKDKTGASIGEVSEVKTDGGKTMATIKMGADTFAVDAASLGVAEGSATINATQAEIQQMLKK